MRRAKTHTHRDYSHEVRKHRFVWVQVAFATMGTLFLIIGIIGIVTPILPTTPFLLLATACYARSSRRFYNYLLNHPSFGPLIIEWRTYRSIPRRIKLVAIVTMVLTFGSSIIFFIKDGRMQLALAFFGLMMAVWLYRIPSRDAKFTTCKLNGHGNDATHYNETSYARFPLSNFPPQAGERANESLREFQVNVTEKDS